VAAQLAALRGWCGDAAGTVVVHRKSSGAGRGRRAGGADGSARAARGAPTTPLALADLQALDEKPAVVVVELPLRRAGFRLPDWDELVAISAWCRAHGVKLHFDGARLWESAPHYGRSLAEICALADSVYVSFYRAWAVAGSIAGRPGGLHRRARPGRPAWPAMSTRSTRWC
jgi:threonine aldolase